MKVMTTGTFDIPHAGHLAFLRKAAALGDEMIVGVLSDHFVMGYKGESPVFNEVERATLIQQATDFDTLVVDDQREFFIQQAGIESIIAVGSDWSRKNYYGQIGMSRGMLETLGVTLAYVPYTEGISTSEIRRRIISHPAVHTSSISYPFDDDPDDGYVWGLYR